MPVYSTGPISIRPCLPVGLALCFLAPLTGCKRGESSAPSAEPTLNSAEVQSTADAGALSTSRADASAAPAHVMAASPIVGRYGHAHTIWIVCDEPDGCEEEVEDRLLITEDRGESIVVDIELVQTNAHICTFQGELERRDRLRWSFEASEDHEFGECKLELRIEQGLFVLDSEGCRDYCGARAHMMASFELATQGPL